MSRSVTREQERASFALQKLESLKDDRNLERYKRNAKRLPSLITTNGLILTLAFLKSKEETKQLYEHIREWLNSKGYCKGDALEYLINDSDFSKLRLATMEALELAKWLKRFAEAEK